MPPVDDGPAGRPAGGPAGDGPAGDGPVDDGDYVYLPPEHSMLRRAIYAVAGVLAVLIARARARRLVGAASGRPARRAGRAGHAHHPDRIEHLPDRHAAREQGHHHQRRRLPVLREVQGRRTVQGGGLRRAHAQRLDEQRGQPAEEGAAATGHADDHHPRGVLGRRHPGQDPRDVPRDGSRPSSTPPWPRCARSTSPTASRASRACSSRPPTRCPRATRSTSRSSCSRWCRSSRRWATASGSTRPRTRSGCRPTRWSPWPR